MHPKPGHNLKYFYNDESRIIRRATASVHNMGETLGFNVPTEQKDIIKNLLGGLIKNEWKTDTYGTWLDVTDIMHIQSALGKLLLNELIPRDFYNNIMENFPKPGGGTVNLLQEKYPVSEDKEKFKKMLLDISRQMHRLIKEMEELTREKRARPLRVNILHVPLSVNILHVPLSSDEKFEIPALYMYDNGKHSRVTVKNEDEQDPLKLVEKMIRDRAHKNEEKRNRDIPVPSSVIPPTTMSMEDIDFSTPAGLDSPSRMFHTPNAGSRQHATPAEPSLLQGKKMGFQG